MKWLTFTNDGLLDVMGLLLMGASTKRNDKDKIGEYGTGWKYALATLARNQVPIYIYIDGKEVPIELETVQMSGDTFQAFIINGKHAYFTTGMGPDWKLWMAIREIYCNCLDEKNPVVEQEVSPRPYGGKSQTIVKIGITEDVENIIDHWMEYFSFERTDDVFEIPGRLKVFRKYYSTKSIIYRRGVKVAESDKAGCFDYDFYSLPINEIREADFYDVKEALKSHLLKDADAEVIRTILGSVNTWEKDLNFYEWDRIINKSAWQTGIGKTYVVPTEHTISYEDSVKELIEEDKSSTILLVPSTMARLISSQVPDTQVFGFTTGGEERGIPVEMSDAFNENIGNAFQMLQDCGFITPGEFLIVCCEYNDRYTKIKHENNTLHISKQCESMELRALCVLILKEIFLIKSGLKKASTDFEDYLVGSIVDAIIGI
jgi:hypothetical protein